MVYAGSSLVAREHEAPVAPLPEPRGSHGTVGAVQTLGNNECESPVALQALIMGQVDLLFATLAQEAIRTAGAAGK